MRRYSTQRLRVRTNVDLTGCDVYLTLSQGSKSITLKDPEIDDMVLTFRMVQTNTARFSESQPIRLQLNAIDSNGFRAVSNIIDVTIDENLLERVVKYGS